MGWCSATEYFDLVVKKSKEVLDEVKSDYSDHIPAGEMLVRIVEPLARALEDGDWDCQQDSDYFEELKWDVFPEIAADIEEDRRRYGD